MIRAYPTRSVFVVEHRPEMPSVEVLRMVSVSPVLWGLVTFRRTEAG